MRCARYAFPALGAALLAACAISIQQELAIGQQYATQLDQQLPIVRDAAMQADLDRIAARLTPYSQRPEITYRFRIVNSAVVNAFAVPGGYIYVTRALIENAATMDQLAGVLGHEIGHVEHRHSAKQIGRAQATQLGVGVAEVLTAGSRAADAVSAGATITGGLVLARYSRAQEEESDRTAVDFAVRARINPDGIVGFFRTLQQVEGGRPGTLESFFASHPMTDDRIAATTALIAATPAATALRETGERDAPEFQRLKAAARRLPPPSDARPASR